MAFLNNLFKSDAGNARRSYPPLGKHFFAKNMANKLVMTLDKDQVSEGTPVIMRETKHGSPVESYQTWFEHPSTGTIRTLEENFCLDCCIEDGTVFVSRYKPGSLTQRWEITDKVIRCRCWPNLVLAAPPMESEDTDGPIAVQVVEFAVEDSKRWKFEYKKASSFHIVSKQNDKVVDVQGENRRPDAMVAMYRAWDEPHDNQLWYEDNHGIIKSIMNDFALDSSLGSIRLQPYDPSNVYQQWVKGPDGRIHRLHHPNDVLEIQDAKMGDGAEIAVNSFCGRDNQLWRFSDASKGASLSS